MGMKTTEFRTALSVAEIQRVIKGAVSVPKLRDKVAGGVITDLGRVPNTLDAAFGAVDAGPAAAWDLRATIVKKDTTGYVDVRVYDEGAGRRVELTRVWGGALAQARPATSFWVDKITKAIQKAA